MNRYVSIGVFVILLAVAVIWWTNSGQEKTAKDATQNTDGKPMVSISMPQIKGSASQGQQIFNENCALCHGENAVGKEGAGPPLIHIIYEPNHHADITFHFAVERGVRAHHWKFGNMPPVEGISKEQVEKIIAFVRTVQRENGIN